MLETVRSGNKEFHDNICYSEAVQSAIGQLSDADVARSIASAGYGDILEAFNIEVPAEEEVAEVAAEEVAAEEAPAAEVATEEAAPAEEVVAEEVVAEVTEEAAPAEEAAAEENNEETEA